MNRGHLDRFKTPTEKREFLIYYARVLLREARARRRSRPFHLSLIEWAGKARRDAASIDLRPSQPDLFG